MEKICEVCVLKSILAKNLWGRLCENTFCDKVIKKKQNNGLKADFGL
jgi:hypothetical protein